MKDFGFVLFCLLLAIGLWPVETGKRFAGFVNAYEQARPQQPEDNGGNR